ncbi:MAG: sodium/proton-translocating pyrophosphatase [Bacillota bacterium]|nr:sodium/proton-translocating pyrophosphatase [Bacillota bacterium]
MPGLKAASIFEAISIWCILIIAVLALVYALMLYYSITKNDKENEKLRDLNNNIKLSTNIYWYNQLKVILPIMIFIMLLLFVYVVVVPLPKEALDRFKGFTEDQVKVFVGVGSVIAFIVGSLFSIMISQFGMSIAIRGKLRVVAAANTGFSAALKLAYRSGAITGIIGDGLGLLGGALILIMFGKAAPHVFLGFGLGVTLIAIFMRVGGGIYPKTADYTAVALDVFQSYEITILSTLVLGIALGSIANDYKFIIFPIILRCVGIVSSMIGTYIVGRKNNRELNAMRSIGYGFYVSAVISLTISFIISYFYMHQWAPALSMAVGIILAAVLNKVTKYFIDIRNKPTNDIARTSQKGEHALILGGIISGFEVSAWKVLTMTLALLAVGAICWDQSVIYLFYCISMMGVGMLMFTINNMAMYSFGTICCDYDGMKEVCDFDENCRRVLHRLDAAGNTSRAVAKTSSVESAVIASIALFGALLTIVSEIQLQLGFGKTDVISQTGVRISNPKVFTAALIGISVILLLTSLVVRMVNRALAMMWRELAKPFCIPTLVKKVYRDIYERRIDNYMLWAHKQMAALALIAMLSMVVVGVTLGIEPLGGFIIGGIFSAQLLITFISSSGSQWYSAKKTMEYGLYEESGLQTNNTLLVADKVGNPLRKGSWSTLNTMNKSISFMGLLIAPLLVKYCSIITMGTIILSCICIVIIIAAIVYCKKQLNIDEVG